MILDDKYYPYPNECVMERNIKAGKEGKRSYIFYQAWCRKSYQYSYKGNPMGYVYGSNIRYKNYDLWAEIINDTFYFHEDDGDVDVGTLSEDWGPHKKGSYVVYPKMGMNGHWVAVEKLKLEKIYFRVYTALHRATYQLQEIMVCDHAHLAGKNVSHKRVVWDTDKKKISNLKLPENATEIFDFYFDFDSEINIFHDVDFWKNTIKNQVRSR